MAKVNEGKIDKGFPFRGEDGAPSYYPGQREAIVDIIQAFEEGNRYVIVDAPTGAGKSGIAATVSAYYGGGCWATTPKNMLVDQYKKLGFRLLKGAGNYDCCNYGGSCQQAMTYYKAKGELHKEARGCCKQCGYKNDAEDFFDPDWEGGCITNTHFMWSGLGLFTKLPPKELLVVDEAHLLESTLADMVKVVVRKEDLDAIDFDIPLTNESGLDAWIAKYTNALDLQITKYLDILKNSKLDRASKSIAELVQSLDHLTRRRRNIRTYTDFSTATSWIRKLQVDSKNRVEKVEMEPVYGGFLAEHLFSTANRILLMSATFLDKHHTSIELRIPENKLAYIRMPSYFPPENQLMFWDPELRLNFGNMEQNLPRLVEKIDRILDHHIGERGLIHTVSYKLTNSILALTRHRKRMSVVKDGEKQVHAIEKHYKKKGSILIGPAFVEGLDLAGDTGSFCIFPKVPFPPIATDEKLATRERSHPGYGNLLTARSIVQGKGRVTRSDKDFSTSYFLDGNLSMLLRGPSASYFPDLFWRSLRIVSEPI